MIQFNLDPKSGVPIYRQIQDQIRYGIGSGKELLPGSSNYLPTVRASCGGAVRESQHGDQGVHRAGTIRRPDDRARGAAPSSPRSPAMELTARDRSEKLRSACASNS